VRAERTALLAFPDSFIIGCWLLVAGTGNWLLVRVIGYRTVKMHRSPIWASPRLR